MKRFIAFLLAFLVVFSMAACGASSPSTASQSSSAQSVSIPEKPSSLPASSALDEPVSDDEPEQESKIEEDSAIDEHGYYYSAEDVALYLYTYNKLPDNFITKSEAPKDVNTTNVILTPTVRTAAEQKESFFQMTD